jgi:hypothetical protein
MFNDVWVLSNADGLGGPSTWTQLSPTGGPPSARGYHSAAYDAVNNRMMVFAGDPNIGYCFGAVNDVWVLTNADGTGGTPHWTQLLSPTGGPPQLRQDPKAVYDSATNRMIVFGGRTNACGSASNEVWVLQNANGLGGAPVWTQLAPVGGPPAPRGGHSAVYDSANNRMIMFAGCGPGACPSGDVWVLENANGVGTPAWMQLSPTGGPPSVRYFHSAVYDAVNNRMVVFGGVGGLNDVWVLANANGLGGMPNWTQQSPTGVLPSKRDAHTAIYNPATNRMVTFAGRSCTGGCSGSEFFALNDVWVLTNANGIVQPTVTPFAAFTGQVEFEMGTPGAKEDEFQVEGAFTLNSTSNGIDPVTEGVTLDLNQFSITVPPGSFVGDPVNGWEFQGIINGVEMEAQIQPTGPPGSYEFTVEGQQADLTGMQNPVTVTLTIGDESGRANVQAQF